MAELLIELFMEEIPARMQVRAGDEFKRLVTDKLSASGITFTSATAHSTPRRLALVVDGLPVQQADVVEEKKGPRVGSPEQALAGFLKSAGLASIDQAEQRDTGKGVFYFAVTHKKGGRTADALPGIIDAAIRELPWPKSMRWGANDFRWVRPLHSIVALFDGQVVKYGMTTKGTNVEFVEIGSSFEERFSEEYKKKFGGIVAANKTQGHRFMSPGTFAVTSFADYQEKLLAAHVVLDREERKRLILAGAHAAAAAEGYRLKDDPGLLEEVAGLVEWPVVLTGAIDDKFMDVPAEVLTTSMRTHQRYFALESADGTLAPRFVVVANRTTIDGGKAVVAGNERVLRARLSDAKFFWDQDLKVKLEERVAGLKDITFHAKLGTLLQRVERIEALSIAIAKALGWDDETVAQAGQAARLSKSDLTTGVVGEFPEVQGVMGRYVAYHEGLPAAVAEAIADHYKPLGPSDRVPTDKVSVAVALAEKIDTLVAFFFIDEKPTGSRDPFALRRAALGAIRLIVENGLRTSIGSLLDAGDRIRLSQSLGSSVDEDLEKSNAHIQGLAKIYGDNFASEIKLSADEVRRTSKEFYELMEDVEFRGPHIDDLLSFFNDRLKVALKEKGIRHDLIDAVLAVDTGNKREDDFVRLLARVDALSGFLSTDDGANLTAAFKRASNILRIEEKKDGKSFNEAVDATLLTQDEEKALADALTGAYASAAPLIAAEDFTGAMAAFAALRAPVDAFFEKVTVNDADAAVRANRLRLLSQIRATLSLIADFSKIEG